MKHEGYHLEQAIIQCWQVCEDLKEGKIDQQVLAQYYDAKFNKLWDIFEELTHDRYFTSSTRTAQKSNSQSDD